MMTARTEYDTIPDVPPVLFEASLDQVMPGNVSGSTTNLATTLAADRLLPGAIGLSL